MIANGRTFLFLQGPHGPFYGELARALQSAGAGVRRIGFNQGDRWEWPDRHTYSAFTDQIEAWQAYLDAFIARENVTDMLIYGDMRAIHVIARKVAAARGVTVHCFEEGYLRPYWITYERGGVNGNSRLMRMSVNEMGTALAGLDEELVEAPASWGATLAHAWHGAVYHWQILFRNRRYPNFITHRTPGVRRELLLFTRQVMSRPFQMIRRVYQERRLHRSGAVYHLVMLQLGHDSSMVHHSPFSSVAQFMELCIDAFKRGAPRHHRLVFKAHPFEDGREPLRRIAKSLASRHDVSDRVDFLQGGKLGRLLDRARSAVTVNSTAGQQALWRKMPVSIHGECVYAKPELVSSKPLAAFFASPDRPDAAAYRDYRRFLLETSQVRGGYYTSVGRASAVRHVIDMLLDTEDPYDRLAVRNRSKSSDAPPAPVFPRALG